MTPAPRTLTLSAVALLVVSVALSVIAALWLSPLSEPSLYALMPAGVAFVVAAGCLIAATSVEPTYRLSFAAAIGAGVGAALFWAFVTVGVGLAVGQPPTSVPFILAAIELVLGFSLLVVCLAVGVIALVRRWDTATPVVTLLLVALGAIPLVLFVINLVTGSATR